jgi:hypothetical protein
MLIPKEDWADGPSFHVYCFFSEPILNVLSTDTGSEILRVLGIEGPWVAAEQVGRSELTRADWVSLPITYGLRHISPTITLLAKVIPDIRKAGYELLLSIPPRQVEERYGPYPWGANRRWATKKVVQLHRELMDRCRALDSLCGLRAAMLAVEEWTCSLSGDATGIHVHPDVAAAAGFEGKRQGRLFAIPF